MSSETQPEGLPRMRCEAVTPNTRPTTLDCHRSHDALLRTRSTPVNQLSADDPAVAIGLALGHVRTQDGLAGTVPPRVMAHLLIHIERGDPACEVVMDWLAKRSRNAEMQGQRRRVHERPRQEPGTLRKRALRALTPAESDLAIIAETEEGKTDE
ncbi:hypothetical protein [Rhizobium sp. 'Codium 1']|uniref:hypothetical protein n=1 Tax=Rhizobium sp. 'Codium 1' TaxID=2940484 RepID=UPI001E588538|nr:hypothetical protein [Rhizobium sp. 'Codium 1']MCC8934843.1 hypothetical protein [Rhizobium sp. 'Codium 1']